VRLCLCCWAGRLKRPSALLVPYSSVHSRERLLDSLVGKNGWSVNLRIGPAADLTQQPFSVMSADRLTMLDQAGNLIAQRVCR
jgi:hypothetical protein